ncbi:MAG: hypothetical protein R2911_18915 [Caldilineaceae bacterium]
MDAFNGSVFGESNQLAPDTGFIAWLAWVVQVQGEKSILFDTDYYELRESFKWRTRLLYWQFARAAAFSRAPVCRSFGHGAAARRHQRRAGLLFGN